MDWIEWIEWMIHAISKPSESLYLLLENILVKTEQKESHIGCMQKLCHKPKSRPYMGCPYILTSWQQLSTSYKAQGQPLSLF